MGAKCVNQGLQRCGINTWGVGTAPNNTISVTRYVQCLSTDDSTNAIAATDTAANTGGAITNFYSQNFDGAATRSNQTISNTCTIATGNSNFTIKRILCHDNTTGSVSASSTTLYGGVDAQTLAKASTFSLAITMNNLFQDAS